MLLCDGMCKLKIIMQFDPKLCLSFLWTWVKSPQQLSGMFKSGRCQSLSAQARAAHPWGWKGTSVNVQQRHLGKRYLIVGIWYWQSEQSDDTQCFETLVSSSNLECLNFQLKGVNGKITWEVGWCNISPLALQGVHQTRENSAGKSFTPGLFIVDITSFGQKSSSLRSISIDAGRHI